MFDGVKQVGRAKQDQGWYLLFWKLLIVQFCYVIKSIIINKVRMSNYSDLCKMVEFLDESSEGKTYLGTNKSHAYYYFGETKSLQKYRILQFNKSSGASNISNDELFQQMKQKVIQTASLTCEEAKKRIVERLEGLYPEHCVNVFVWNSGNMCHTSFYNSKAGTRFQASQNKAYGHDVLIILT